MKDSYIDSLQKHYIKKEKMLPDEAYIKASLSWEIYYKNNKVKIDTEQKENTKRLNKSISNEFINLEADN
jgi:hypothetical protein